MQVLLDESVPRRIKHELRDYYVATVNEMGWLGKENGDLLRAAEELFDVFVTVDKNLEYQQNLKRFNIAIILLVASSNTFERLSPLVPKLIEALATIKRGQFIRLRS